MRRIIVEQNSPKYEYSNTEVTDTGFRLYTVTSDQSSIKVHIPEVNKDLDITAFAAWVGARTSRSNTSYSSAYKELYESLKVSPRKAAEKLHDIIGGYGHSSVGDMAVIPIHLNHIPIHLAEEIWLNLSVGAGQESSTRYIPFEGLEIDKPEYLFDLDEISEEERNEITSKWEQLTVRMNQLYKKWNEDVREKYAKKFPSASDRTLNSRSFDISRQWLPFGTHTSMSLFLSARNWGQLIKSLSESEDKSNKQLASQLKYALSLGANNEDIKINASEFLTHTEPVHQLQRNKKKLKKYLLSETDILETVDRIPLKTFEVKESKVQHHHIKDGMLVTALQFLMDIFPQIDEKTGLKWLSRLSIEKQEKFKRIMLKGFDKHELMGNFGDIRGVDIFSLSMPISAARDLARHRAWGRMQDTFSYQNAYELLNQGFVANYALFNTKGFEKLREDWVRDAHALYEELRDLIYTVEKYFPKSDSRWLLRVLPLGNMCRLQMSGPISQQIYMYSLRTARGGDFEYIKVVEDMEHLSALNTKFGMKEMRKRNRLKPNSAKAFKTRS